MTTPDLLDGRLASGEAGFSAEPLSDGPARVGFSLTLPGTVARRYIEGPFGNLTLILGGAEVAAHTPMLVDYVDKATKRIDELKKNTPAPWGDSPDSARVSAETGHRGQEIVTRREPEPVVVVSPDAEAAAIAVFDQFALRPPPSAVAIFPREDGGLRLQAAGEERTVIVDISMTGTEFVGEYAGDDVYHTETMRNSDDAARFIVDSTR